MNVSRHIGGDDDKKKPSEAAGPEAGDYDKPDELGLGKVGDDKNDLTIPGE